MFQVFQHFCYWDATALHPDIASTRGRYATEIVFVEAPDYVREGWGYDETAKGDARFIEPTPPEGWLYHSVQAQPYRNGTGVKHMGNKV